MSPSNRSLGPVIHGMITARLRNACSPVLILMLGAFLLTACSNTKPPAATIAAPQAAPDANDAAPSLALGAGDTVDVKVYGSPELSTTTYVADNGTVTIPLAGAVKVAGLTPNQAAQAVAEALKKGQYLRNPQVTVLVTKYRSQQVSVLGAVKTPGRYPIESKTTVLDLLASAGGTTDNSAKTIYLLHTTSTGTAQRFAIDLLNLGDPSKPIQKFWVRGGDTVFVPDAPQFYIYGEVHTPNQYRLEPGMTVLQAISRGGGLTDKGTDSGVTIRRHNANGSYKTLHPKLSDTIHAGDVIRVKERWF